MEPPYRPAFIDPEQEQDAGDRLHGEGEGQRQGDAHGRGHARNRADDRSYQYSDEQDGDVLEGEEQRDRFEEVVQQHCAGPLDYPRRLSNTPSGIGMLATYTKKK